MEFEPKPIIVADKKNNVVPNEEETTTTAAAAIRRKRGGMNFLKVALLMIRRRSGNSKTVDMASKGMWNRLVSSMRPLHLQSSESPRLRIETEPKMMSERYDDVMLPPASPLSTISSEDGMSSRYASAVNLQELDKEEYEEVLVVDDELIDSKAEEFIAQFYEQMRLQRVNSIDRRFDEMNKRSIG